MLHKTTGDDDDNDIGQGGISSIGIGRKSYTNVCI